MVPNTRRAAASASLTRSNIVDGRIQNFEQALGRRPLIVSRVGKTTKDGREVLEVTTIELFATDPSAANQAGKLLIEELAGRESLSGG